MRFRMWLAKQPSKAAACDSLGISRRTLYNWLTGKNEPGPVAMRKIIRVSKGAVTFKDLLQGI